MIDIRPADDGTTIDESEADAIVHEPQPDAADLPDAVHDGEAGQTSAEDDPAIAQEHPTEDNA